MYVRSEETLNQVDLATKIIADAVKEYWQRWRLYTLTVIIGWWSLIVVELVAIAVLGAPYLRRLEPFFFQLASDTPFNFTDAVANLDIQAIVMYLALISGLLIIETWLIQNVVIGALINVASGQAQTPLQAYRMSVDRYFNLFGVALITACMIILPTTLLVLPICAILIVAPQLIDAGLGLIVSQIFVVAATLLLIPASIVFVLRFALGPQHVVIEGTNAVSAVRRSWRMLKGWRGLFGVFAVHALLVVGNVLLGFIATLTERELIGLIGAHLGIPLFVLFLVSHAFAMFIGGLLLPFQAISLTFFYRQLSSQDNSI